MVKFYKVVVPNKYLDKLLYKGEIVIFSQFYTMKNRKKVYSYKFSKYDGFDGYYHNFSTVCKLEHLRRICLVRSWDSIGRLSEDSCLLFLDRNRAKEIKRKINKLRKGDLE